MNQKQRLRTSIAAAALAALFAGSALAQTPAPARGPGAARARLDVHRQRRPLQPIRVPRHFADQREAGAAGRLRPRPQERLLRGHVGIEHLVAVGRQSRRVREPGMGFLRRLQAVRCPTTSRSTWASSTTGIPGTYPSGYTKPNTTELYVGLAWKWISAKYSYSVSDTFGFADSDGSDYWELQRFLRRRRQGQRRHRQGHALRSRRQAEVQEQRLLRLRRLEGRHLDGNLRLDGRHLRHRHRRRKRGLHEPLRQGHRPTPSSSATSRRHSDVPLARRC